MTVVLAPCKGELPDGGGVQGGGGLQGDSVQDNEWGKELRPSKHYVTVDTKQDIGYVFAIRIYLAGR